MDLLFETNRKKASKYQLKFYKEPPQAVKRPRTEKNHSYVKYISTPLGGVSATQSSIQTLATIIAGTEDHGRLGIARPDEHNDWIDTGDHEPPLDQAYLNHISEGVTDERQKRERPKGVSPKCLHDINKPT